MIANIGHEPRTAVNHIIGYSEMLQEESEDRRATHLIADLQGIQIEGQKLLSLVLDILESARAGPAETLERLRHELRTPLRTTMGYSEKLKADAAGSGHEDFVQDLDRIAAAAKNWLAFVNTSLGVGGESRMAPPVPTGLAGFCPVAGNRPKSNWSAAGGLLVVDNNETNRDLLSRSLERQGYRVELAENGVQALDKVRSEDYDLVLLDVLMPDMDGLEVLRALKADESSSEIPVLVLSSLDDTDGEAYGERFGK